MSDGREEIKYLDGSVVTVEANGDRVLLLPNGQKEVHTKEHKVKQKKKREIVWNVNGLCFREGNTLMAP